MADVGKVAVQERYGSGCSSPVEWCNRFVSFGLGAADSSPGMNVEFKALRWFSLGGQGTFPKGCRYTCERAAQLYLPEATSGCPSSARAGAPVGAKEEYKRLPNCYSKYSKAPDAQPSELPPVSWTTKLKSKKREAFHVYTSGIKT